MIALTDESPMPFGKYARSNTAMANVPASYLLWLYDELKTQREKHTDNQKVVFEYIEDNLDALKKEIS